jgi:hypothetical protein
MCYHYLFVTGQQESISGFKNSYRQDFHEIINYPITHHAAQNDLLECISFDPASRRVRIDAPQWNSANSSKMKYPYIDPSLLHDVIDMCELEFVGKDSILIRFNPYYWDFIGILSPLSSRYPDLDFRHEYYSGFGNFCEIFWLKGGEVYDFKIESTFLSDPDPKVRMNH